MINNVNIIFEDIVSKNINSWVERSVVPACEIKSMLMEKTGGVYSPTWSFCKFLKSYCEKNNINLLSSKCVRFESGVKRCYVFIK